MDWEQPSAYDMYLRELYNNNEISEVSPPDGAKISPLQAFESRITSSKLRSTKGCNINDSFLDISAVQTLAPNADYIIYIGGLDETQEGEIIPNVTDPDSASTTVTMPAQNIAVNADINSGQYSEITIPFEKNGSGEFWYKTDVTPAYINSCNLNLLEINGIDYTNLWQSGSNLPAKQDGYYYIHYKSSVGWGHFEIKQINKKPGYTNYLRFFYKKYI